MTLRTTDVPRPLLLFALLAGAGAWTVHLVGSSALVPAACAHDLGWTIDALTVVTAGVCVAGIGASIEVRRRTRSDDDPTSDALGILSFVAITANVLSLALVLAEGLMPFWFGACQ